MPSLVLRLVVLSLALLFQAGSWSSEANSAAASAFHAESAPLDDDGAGGCEAPEDGSEEPAVDDSLGSDVVPAGVPNWCRPPARARGYAWVDGLAPGGPPADTPFKPPRA
jgi:hypothetical protein